MRRYVAKSRCSETPGPSFRWYGYPQCAVGDDFDTALEVLLDAVSKSGRVWSPEARAMARAEFRQRLNKAKNGRLDPVDEVPPIDVKNPPPLYEIRWQNLPVTERSDEGVISHKQVLVRLYHSEPEAVAGYFIGHHAHEKLIDVEDVNETQQQEIKLALKWYTHGEDSTWGIASTDTPDIE